MTKERANELLESVIKSCEEGKDGTWDCTTDEGKEGFDDMASCLEMIKEYINQPPTSVEFMKGLEKEGK